MTRRMRAARPGRPHGGAAAALRRLHAGHPLAHAAEATAHTQTILATARGLLATAMPLIERQGLTLLGIALGNLDDDRAVQLALPFDAPAGQRARRRARRRARPVRIRRPSPAPCCSAATTGSTVPLLPD